MEFNLRDLEDMNLGVIACQRKRVEVGNYRIVFRRRKVEGDYMYLVELSLGGKVIERGAFTDFREATIFAGRLFRALL
ncbi:MAG: hypothetical protein RXS23_03275 [Metallosphaera yellowstonensis]|jgi:hypothetical protein|uniref:Uncharacterized protein n=1 Tax=Metallosphaera yellowstonensis MK1 TaxID=671065 RepID=H2C2Y0_9CREN|nr:hypothetical protein [Metallosphaera yellowstonensis]EHP70601.1 hypothetical protein MetMK1DRAFT_00011040 [Metallosphaera yellowstonensis MK1]